jgi:hypothetical protein
MVAGSKKIFSGKNFRLWFGSVQQRRAMFSGQNFWRLSILVFKAGGMCPRSVYYDLLVYVSGQRATDLLTLSAIKRISFISD